MKKPEQSDFKNYGDFFFAQCKYLRYLIEKTRKDAEEKLDELIRDHEKKVDEPVNDESEVNPPEKMISLLPNRRTYSEIYNFQRIDIPYEYLVKIAFYPEPYHDPDHTRKATKALIKARNIANRQLSKGRSRGLDIKQYRFTDFGKSSYRVLMPL